MQDLGGLERPSARRSSRGAHCLPVVRTHTDNSWVGFKKHKTLFFIVDEPPSWSDADDSLEAISDSEEDKDDRPDDKDSMHRAKAKVTVTAKLKLT